MKLKRAKLKPSQLDAVAALEGHPSAKMISEIRRVVLDHSQKSCKSKLHLKPSQLDTVAELEGHPSGKTISETRRVVLEHS